MANVDNKTEVNSSNIDSTTEETKNVISVEENKLNNVFAYLERSDFTSEKFKIEIRNLPRYYGISELKKLLKDKLKLDSTKIKTPKKCSPWAYVCFRNDDIRQTALTLLNGYKWKGKVLSANVADAAPDPLVLKRNQEQETDTKKLKLSQSAQLQSSTVPYFEYPYEKQLELKQNDIRQILLELGNATWRCNSMLRPWIEEQRSKYDGLPCELWDIRSANKYDGYRTKCEFTVGMDHETQLPTVGFRLGSYVNGFTGVAPVEELPHIPERMKIAVKVFEKFVRQSELKVFNPEFQSGEFKVLTARWSTTSDELMLIIGIQIKDMTEDQIQKLKKDLIDYFSENEEGSIAKVTSLYFKVVQKRGPNEPHFQPEHLWGTKYIQETILNLTFRVSPDAFFQVNTEGAEILYSSAIELTKPTKDTAVVDIYCGTGTIGLCFAKHCGQVLGLELIEDAVIDARMNAEMNEISNTEFYQGKAEDILLSVMKKSSYEDLIAIVDPPRAGLHQKAVIQLRQMKNLKKLLYVSCNPNAAIKNFIDFSRPQSKTLHYEPLVPIKAVAVDLFPHTKHCELLIYFERFNFDTLKSNIEQTCSDNVVENSEQCSDQVEQH